MLDSLGLYHWTLQWDQSEVSIQQLGRKYKLLNWFLMSHLYCGKMSTLILWPLTHSNHSCCNRWHRNHLARKYRPDFCQHMARAKVQWGFHILVGEAVWSRGRDNQWREQQEHSAHRGRPSILILRSLLLSSMFPSRTARSFSTLSSPSLSFLFPSFSSLSFSLFSLLFSPLFSPTTHKNSLC